MLVTSRASKGKAVKGRGVSIWVEVLKLILEAITSSSKKNQEKASKKIERNLCFKCTYLLILYALTISQLFI